ncbi:MAG: hypothetical protein K2K70_07875, partial [Lachnospiraceae bacterium]|nr:hypothetical protein [Lachnospiraceae bacterium]
MKRGLSIRSKWKWIAGIFAVCLVVFTAVGLYRHLDVSQAAGPYVFTNSNGDQVPAGGTMELRRATDTLTITQGLETNDVCEWSSTDTSILQVDNTGRLTVQDRVGNVLLNVKIKHTQGELAGQEEVISLTVSVVFSINEYLSNNKPQGVSMERIKPDDTRKALVMDYGTKINFGSSAKDEPEKLNLIFGSAVDTAAVWRSSNEDVFSVNNTSDNKPYIKAEGAGVATLTVEYTDGTLNYADSIQVYVRPQVTDPLQDDKVIAGPINAPTQTEVFNNGDKMGVSIQSVRNPLELVGDKLIWVISKGEGESAVLVRDSLGNMGPDGNDAKLQWIENNSQFRIDAKAGVYTIQFYVKGTYTNFEDAHENPPACQPVSLRARVLAKYEDKEVTVNIHGSYNLAEAFNIPENMFRQYFNVSYDLAEYPSTETYIGLRSDGVTIDAKNLGTGRVIVTLRDSDISIPGVSSSPENQTVYVTVHVTEEFSLNQTSAIMPVGSTLSLYGEIGSGEVVDPSRFTWSVSDPSYVSIQTSNNDGVTGQYATITATKKTPTNQPVHVTLTWLDSEGINHTSTCRITVVEAANSFRITPNVVVLDGEGKTEVLDTKLTGTQNIQWLTSDPSKVTVTALEGNTKATITSGRQTGQAVITAINMDNGVF